MTRSTRTLHVATAYAAGEITEDECVDVLSVWPYTSALVPPPGVYSDMSFRGNIADLSLATHQRLISDEMYDAIVKRLSDAYEAKKAEEARQRIWAAAPPPTGDDMTEDVRAMRNEDNLISDSNFERRACDANRVDLLEPAWDPGDLGTPE